MDAPVDDPAVDEPSVVDPPVGGESQQLDQYPIRELGRRVPGPNRVVYAAGALALTEPGPAAVGVVIADEHGRLLAQRSHYAGRATRAEANAQALVSAMRLAVAGGLEAPAFRIDDAALADAASHDRELPDGAAPLTAALRELQRQLPGARIEVVPSGNNRARATALAPLVDWLPERTRRAEDLSVRTLGDGSYEVASESQPGQTYHVTLLQPGQSGDGSPLQCECADFLYRGIPCKHILAVAREANALDKVFYR
jgi:hypothetical protein